MSRRTNKSRSIARDNVLHARVWSSRMLRIGFFKLLFRSFKPLCLLALLGGSAWGVRLGVRWAFYDNADFRLQAVDLNPNPAIDELDFVKLTGIDLRSNLFRLDREAIAKSLAALPQISAARVERQLPGTLVVRVTARTPLAWIACPDAGLPAARQVGAMLVDDHDIAYPCPARQFEAAGALPIILLPARDKEAIAVGKKILQPELQRCTRLLTSARASDPDAGHWIDSIKQANAWSLALTTREGTVATLGLGDHARQMANLRAALNHAETKGYVIATINLIPKENVPVTVAIASNAGGGALSDRKTGIPPVREDSASSLSAHETTGWKPADQDRQDASPPAKLAVLPAAANTEAASPKTTPPKATPPKTVPPKTVPLKTVPPKTVPPKAVPLKATPPKTVPPKTVPPKTAPPKAVPVAEPTLQTGRQDRRNRDMKALLNRN